MQNKDTCICICILEVGDYMSCSNQKQLNKQMVFYLLKHTSFSGVCYICINLFFGIACINGTLYYNKAYIIIMLNGEVFTVEQVIRDTANIGPWAQTMVSLYIPQSVCTLKRNVFLSQNVEVYFGFLHS